MHQTLLESMLEVTTQGTSQTMDYTLLATLIELIPCLERVTLLRLTQPAEGSTHGDSVLDVSIIRSDTAPVRYEWKQPSSMNSSAIDHFMQKSINRVQTLQQYIREGVHHTFVPIRLAQSVSHLLSLHSAVNLVAYLPLIESFVRIYENHQQLSQQQTRDPLSGLLNRYSFDQHLAPLMQSQRQHKVDNSMYAKAHASQRRGLQADASAWLVRMALDPSVPLQNASSDTMDDVVAMVSRLLRKSFRSTDLLFCFDAHAFVVVLEPTTYLMASNVLERIRQTIYHHRFEQLGRLTVSLGFAELDHHSTAAEVLAHAELALQMARQQGGNQVCNYESLLAQGLLSCEGSSVPILLP